MVHDPNRIAILQRTDGMPAVFRAAVCPDVPAVEERAVAAAQVLKGGVGRIQIQQTVVPGNAFPILSQELDHAVVGPPDDTKHPGIEPIAGAGERTARRFEHDSACHQIDPGC